MAYPNVASYGSWKSPITADVVAAGEVGLEQIRVDGADVYWVERRSQEGGRKVIVCRSRDERLTDITPVGFNARTRVHEYGGGDFAVSKGTIVFSNFTDQRLYLQQPGSEPKPLTPAEALRYADGVIMMVEINCSACARTIGVTGKRSIPWQASTSKQKTQEQ